MHSSRACERPRTHCLFLHRLFQRNPAGRGAQRRDLFENSLVLAGRSRRRGRRESAGGCCAPRQLLRARPGTQVEGEERRGDFLGFLPCTYLLRNGSGPTPLGGRWEAPRLAPASRAPRPRPRSLPVTPASRPRSAPLRAPPRRTEGPRAAPAPAAPTAHRQTAARRRGHGIYKNTKEKWLLDCSGGKMLEVCKCNSPFVITV